MPPSLYARPFSLEMIAELGDFDCGPDVFDVIATEWIFCRNPTSNVRTSMQRETQVWLYYLEATQQLIGFSSLGPTKRKVDGARPPIGYIPQLGLHHNYHGFPPGSEWKDRVSAAIMDDLIKRARELSYNALTLFVHNDNTGAKKLYDRTNFRIVPAVVREDGYEFMMLRLNAT
jgi:ribosomal protein S18 acetylase RimI-like enzyme